jgi:hypothetical protein
MDTYWVERGLVCETVSGNPDLVRFRNIELAFRWWSQFVEFTQTYLNAVSQIIEPRNRWMGSIHDRRVLAQFIASNFPSAKFPLFQLPNEITIKAATPVLNQCKCNGCSLNDGIDTSKSLNSSPPAKSRPNIGRSGGFLSVQRETAHRVWMPSIHAVTAHLRSVSAALKKNAVSMNGPILTASLNGRNSFSRGRRGGTRQHCACAITRF